MIITLFSVRVHQSILSSIKEFLYKPGSNATCIDAYSFRREIMTGFVLLLNIKQLCIAHALHAWTTTAVNNWHAFKSAS